MKAKNYILFIIPSLIWGSTWYAIKFQLGFVHPMMSVAYRFGLAGILLFIFCLVFKMNMKYSARDHFFMALQGISLFGVNYFFVYKAELTLTSGVVAVIFSLIMFMNIFFKALILREGINIIVFVGALLGITGTAYIFRSELKIFNSSNENFMALIYCLISVVLASLGNILSAINQKRSLPVIQTNAFGMVYGSLFMFLAGVILGVEINFDFNPSFIFSLAYLSVFGSIVAFSAYLKLLGNIGPDRAAYTILVIPVIAMIISTIFEGYVWDKGALFGIILLVIGNILAMNRKKVFLNKDANT